VPANPRGRWRRKNFEFFPAGPVHHWSAPGEIGHGLPLRIWRTCPGQNPGGKAPWQSDLHFSRWSDTLKDLFAKQQNMKKILVTMFCLGLAAPLFADGTTEPAGGAPAASTNSTNPFPDEKSRVSYALGMMNGHQWKTQDLDLDPDVYAQGIKDALTGRPTQLTEDQAKQVLDNFRREFMAKQQQKRKEQALKNKADGEAFLSTNKLVPGIKLLSVAAANGQTNELQYLVLTNGSGPLPQAGDKVTVNYRGTLLDGTEFDNSYKRGRPATFQVGEVIKGWTEALKIMPVGSKWRLFIPSDLAYGENGRSGIPGNSVLTFDVELLGIQAPPAPAAPLTSDIIRVPGMDEIKKGAKPEVIKAEDVPKIQAQEQQQQQQQTNK